MQKIYTGKITNWKDVGGNCDANATKPGSTKTIFYYVFYFSALVVG